MPLGGDGCRHQHFLSIGKLVAFLLHLSNWLKRATEKEGSQEKSPYSTVWSQQLVASLRWSSAPSAPALTDWSTIENFHLNFPVYSAAAIHTRVAAGLEDGGWCVLTSCGQCVPWPRATFLLLCSCRLRKGKRDLLEACRHYLPPSSSEVFAY